jgi:hypothetical protein
MTMVTLPVALAAPVAASAPTLPIFGRIGIGTAMILIGLFCGWIIKKRVRHKALAQYLLWMAWIFVALGGEAASHTVKNTYGVGAGGAAFVSVVGLILVVVDLADRRPDWTAILVIIILPWFMRLSGGTIGQFFNLLLAPLAAINQGLVHSLFGW